MSNEERSQIVKERWHTISDRLKAVYVALARLDEEKLAWEAIQDFYKERIDTMRDHAGMKPVVWPLWSNQGQSSQRQGSAVDQKALSTELSSIQQNGSKAKVKKVKKCGKSTTPSDSERQGENSDEACNDDEQPCNSSFAERVVDSVLEEDDTNERKNFLDK